MKSILVVALLASSTIWADTIVSGSSSFQAGVVPFTTNTSFALTLSGGSFSSFVVAHEYQQGAKGGYSADYTSSFSFQPVPAPAISTIGLSTYFEVVLNGVTYYQGFTPVVGAVVPPDGSTFSVQLSLAPISGTNVLDTMQDSTATGLFSLSGSVSADINGVTYTDPFSGYATFNGSYMTNGLPITPVPQLIENYSYIATIPEPGTALGLLSGLSALGLMKIRRGTRSPR